MPKKIIDVLPPGEDQGRNNVEPVVKRVTRTPAVQKPVVRESRSKPRRKFLPVWAWVVLLALVALGSGFLFLTFRSSLELTLAISQETLNLTEELEASTEQIELDLGAMVMPAQYFEEEVEGEQVFQATGQGAEQAKAEGIITVFNKHNPPERISLRATTRFLSAQGSKIFRSPDKITLAPAKMEGGKVIASQTSIKVVADEAGADYNIGNSNFSVPGLAGTELYYSIWAESAVAMSGGFKKEVAQVSAEDLAKAEDNLKEKLKQLALAGLKNKMGAEFVFNEESFSEDDFSVICSEEEGALVSQFSCQGMIKLAGLAFRVQDFKEVALVLIESQMTSTESFREETLTLDFIPRTVLLGEGKMIVELDVEVKTFKPFEPDVLLGRIAGQSEEGIEAVLADNYQQVADAEFKFSPFWVGRAPNNVEKIRVELTF